MRAIKAVASSIGAGIDCRSVAHMTRPLCCPSFAMLQKRSSNGNRRNRTFLEFLFVHPTHPYHRGLRVRWSAANAPWRNAAAKPFRHAAHAICPASQGDLMSGSPLLSAMEKRASPTRNARGCAAFNCRRHGEDASCAQRISCRPDIQELFLLSCNGAVLGCRISRKVPKRNRPEDRRRPSTHGR